MKREQQPSLTRTIPVETRILGWGAERIEVPAPAGMLSVAELIRLKISTEWAALQRGERTDVGRESRPPEDLSGSQTIEQPASLEDAVRTAMDGYRSGWYIILLDGEEPGGLDTRLLLTPETRIAFVRVYPLPDAPPRNA